MLYCSIFVYMWMVNAHVCEPKCHARTSRETLLKMSRGNSTGVGSAIFFFTDLGEREHQNGHWGEGMRYTRHMLTINLTVEPQLAA